MQTTEKKLEIKRRVVFAEVAAVGMIANEIYRER
jgi:hypothetical protein